MAALNEKHTKVKEKSLVNRNKKISDLLFTQPTTTSHKREANVFTSYKLNTLPESDTSSDEKTKQELKIEKHLPLSEERLSSNNETTQQFDRPNCAKTSNSFSPNSAAIHLPLLTNPDSSISSGRLWRSMSTPLMTYEEREKHSTYFRDKFRFVVHLLRAALLGTLSDIYALRETISSHISLARRKTLSDTDVLTKSKFYDDQSTRIGSPTLTNVVLTPEKGETSNSTCLINKTASSSSENTQYTNLTDSNSKSLKIFISADTLRGSNSHREMQEENSQLLQTSNKSSKTTCHEVSEDIDTKCNVTLSDEILMDAYGSKTNVQEDVIPQFDVKETDERNKSEASLHRNMSNDTQLSDLSENTMNSSPSFEANTLTSEIDSPSREEQPITIDTPRTNEETAKLSQIDASRSLMEPPRKKACHHSPQFVTSIYHIQTNNFNTPNQNESNPPTRYLTAIEHTNPKNQDNSFSHAPTKEPATHEVKTQNRLRCFDKHLEKLDIDDNLREKISQVENHSVNSGKYTSKKSVFQSFDAITPQADVQNCYFGKASAIMINPGSDSVLHLPADPSNALHSSLANSYPSSQNECAPPTALTQRNYGATNVPYKRYLVTDLQSTASGSFIPRSVVVQLRSNAFPSSTEIFRKPTSKRKDSSLSDATHITSESVSTEKDVQPCENMKAQMYIENLKKYATMSEQQSAHNYFSNKKLFPFQSDSISFSGSTSSNGSFANTRDATTSTDSSHQIQSQPIFENFNTDRLRSMSGVIPLSLSNSRISQHANSSFIDAQVCDTSRIPETTIIHSNTDRPIFNVEGRALRDPQHTKSLPYMTSEAQHNSTMSHHSPVILPSASPGNDHSRSQIQESKIQRNVQMNPPTKQNISGSLSTLIELPEYSPVSSANQFHKNPLSDNLCNGIKNVYTKAYSIDALDQSCNYAISDITLVQAPFGDTSYFPTQEVENGEEPVIERILFSETMEKVVPDKNDSFIKENSSLNGHSKSKPDIFNSKNIPSMPSVEYPFMDFLGTENWRKEVGNKHTCENLFEQNYSQQTSTTIRTPRSQVTGSISSVDKPYDMKAPIPIRPRVFAVDSQIPGIKEQPPLIPKPTCEISPRDVSSAPSMLNNPTSAAENQVLPTIRADSCNHEYPPTNVLPCSTLTSETSHFCVHRDREGPAFVIPCKNKNDGKSALIKEQPPDGFVGIRKNALGSMQVSSRTLSMNLRPNLNELGKQDNKANVDSSIGRKVRRKILKARRRTSQSFVNSQSIISIQTNISSRQLLEPILEAGGIRNSTTEKKSLRISNDHFYQMNNMDSQRVLNHPYIFQNPANNGMHVKFSPLYQQFNTKDCIDQSLSTGVTTRKATRKTTAPYRAQENPRSSTSVPSFSKRKEPYQIVGDKAHSSKNSHWKSSENIPQTNKYNRSRKVYTRNSKQSMPKILWCPSSKQNSSINNNVSSKSSLGTGNRTLHSSRSSAHATQTNEKDFIPISWRKGVYRTPSKKSQNIFSKNYCSQLLLATLPFRKKSNVKKKVSAGKNKGVQPAKYTDSYLRSNIADLPTCSCLFSNAYDLPSNNFSNREDKNTGTSNAFRFNCAEPCLWAKPTGIVDRKIAKKISKSDETNNASIPSNSERTPNMKQNVTRKILSSFNFKSPFHQKEEHTRNADNRVGQAPTTKKKSRAHTSPPKTDESLLEYSSESIRDPKPRKKQHKSSQSLSETNNTCSTPSPPGDIASLDFSLPPRSFTPMEIECRAPSEHNSNNSLIQSSIFDTSYAQ